MATIDRRIKELLDEVEQAKATALAQWMATEGVNAAIRIGETHAFEWMSERLKSIIIAET